MIHSRSYQLLRLHADVLREEGKSHIPPYTASVKMLDRNGQEKLYSASGENLSLVVARSPIYALGLQQELTVIEVNVGGCDYSCNGQLDNPCKAVVCLADSSGQRFVGTAAEHDLITSIAKGSVEAANKWRAATFKEPA